VNQRKVQVLPEHLANQIAAGEVIQRPESVVKELLENSLDAGAKNIVVIIKEAGRKLIQVVDDGVGMDEEDALASFLRHATSKISSLEDLEAIKTYGFRGEALASIASVAHVTMKTRRSEDDAAVVVHIDGGSPASLSREGKEPGTSITVQNLFYNVPARRKFLKSNSTEFRHIYEAVQRVLLSHPEISLKLIGEDETILELKAATLPERVLDIFGERQVQSTVWTEERGEYVSLSGYIGKPTFGQKSRANQYLFLNGRYITNRNINHAVFSAYENLLLKGTFPFFLLFLEVDPHRVDVNVHPSKMEAKFEDEQNIYRFVSNVVRRTLATNDLVPSMSVRRSEDEAIELAFTNRQHDASMRREFVDRATGEIVLPAEKQAFDRQSTMHFPETRSRLAGFDVVERLAGSAGDGLGKQEPPSEQEEIPKTSGWPARLGSAPAIWQLHNKYILSPIENGMMILDQHVAHERILYERVLKRFETNSPATQQLLFPQTLQLSSGDYALVNELLPYFERLGFSMKPFGRNTMVVEGVPMDVRHGSESRIVEDLLVLYKEYQQHGTLDARDNLAKSFSCKAAIKAGDKLSEQEMRLLVEQLFQTDMPYVCPHGRPIVLKISTDELDRRFGRT
jgi:DNA mismatch repair protein MutL